MIAAVFTRLAQRVIRCFFFAQGKFWKNFGHNDCGQQWLYPEEALFLMDEVLSYTIFVGQINDNFYIAELTMFG